MTSFPRDYDADVNGLLVVLIPRADHRGPIEVLKSWGRANSINVEKVLWCCRELGLQYDRIDAGNEFGAPKTREYRALNPNRIFPTIEDGDFQLWESNGIVRYLAQKSEDSPLSPFQDNSSPWLDDLFAGRFAQKSMLLCSPRNTKR